MDAAHSTDNVRMNARRKYRKLKRSVPEEDPVTHLNITPMMDMMTILVVFFLKSFSVSAESIELGDDLMPPTSTTQIKPQTAVKLTITKSVIMVEDARVIAVKKGGVDSSQKRDGQSGFLITRLVDTLQKHALRLKKLERRGLSKFDGTITIVADQLTPYRLLSEVLYSAGQAEFGKYRLMVLKGGDD